MTWEGSSDAQGRTWLAWVALAVAAVVSLASLNPSLVTGAFSPDGRRLAVALDPDITEIAGARAAEVLVIEVRRRKAAPAHDDPAGPRTHAARVVP